MSKRPALRLDSWLIKKVKNGEITPTHLPENSKTNASNANAKSTVEEVPDSLLTPYIVIAPQIATPPMNISFCDNQAASSTTESEEGFGKKNTDESNNETEKPKLGGTSNSSNESASIEGSPSGDDQLATAHSMTVPPPQQVLKRKFYFQASWFHEYPWIQYEQSLKKILCSSCVEAVSRGLFPENMKIEETFTATGFGNWQHGAERLKRHDASIFHRDALTRLLTAKEAPIASIFDAATTKRQKQAQLSLKSILSTIMYLAGQGLALRGSTEDTGNFMTLLRLRSEDIPELKNSLQQSKNYTSPEIQNELLRMISQAILREVAVKIQTAKLYSIIVDETTDLGVHEQISISIRVITCYYEAEEYFLGLYQTSTTTGQTITEIVLDTLQRFNLPIEDLRGQCYDGGSNMSGQFKGVQARILKLQPKAIFTHCFNHSLNLALQDCVSQNTFFRDLFSHINDIGTIIKSSANRSSKFESIASALGQNVTRPRPLCPTRWTVKLIAVNRILAGYEALLQFLTDLGDSKDKVSAKAKGLQLVMEKAEFILGLLMAKEIFSVAEHLSKILQNPKSTLSGGIEAATVTVQGLKDLKSDTAFKRMWSNMNTKIDEYDLSSPTLPRIRKRPKKFEDQNQIQTFSTAKDRLISIYHDAIDSMCNEIGRRFDQAGLKVYEKLEATVLSSGSNEMADEVCSFYGWEKSKLTSEIAVLKGFKGFTWLSVKDIVEGFRSLKPESRSFFPILDEALRHLLVIPCSSAGAERSFSRLRRIKMYLRTTMSQERLNHCCVINCYSLDILNEIDTDSIIKDFVNHRGREATFGKVVKKITK